MIYKIIIGIGNSDKKFLNTRHNIGIDFIKKISNLFNKKLYYNNFLNGYFSNLYINNKKILIYFPDSFINESGKYINILIKYYKFNIENLVIIHDDMSYNPGISKLKFGGGDSGHNGIKNIIQYFNSKNFYRLRIGIGRPKIDFNNFVLSKPSLIEKKLISKSIDKSIICINKLIEFGPLIAMNYLNSKS